MFGLFIMRKWRLHYVLWFLMVFELPFTVANLSLFGVASPNLYRTILREEGARRGFNSSSKTELYAWANYRPVKTPTVWSSSMTQFNLVIGVLCTFFWLVKSALFLMHVFYPLLSLLLHIALLALWAYSIHMQTSSDTLDPTRKQSGAPWYITKNCNIVDDSRVRGYCMQAKASFAVSVIMLAIYTAFVLLSAYSLIPSSEARAAHRTSIAEKKAEKEKMAALENYNSEAMTPEEQWQHMWELQQLPRTPGFAPGQGQVQGGMAAVMQKMPMTPRTTAFNSLAGNTGGHYENPYTTPGPGYSTREGN